MSTTVPFGKYKGRPVEDMLADVEYMAWLEAQPWFRERFKGLLANRDADAANRTPVHNRLQALFLDRQYAVAFAAVAGCPGAVVDVDEPFSGFEVSDQLYSFSKEIISADVRLCFPWRDEWPGSEHRSFVHKRFYIEIKPTVADEYPAVLRQMTRNRSRYLFVGQYRGEGATEDQFVAIFAAGGIRVVFKRDVDAAADAMRRAAA